MEGCTFHFTEMDVQRLKMKSLSVFSLRNYVTEIRKLLMLKGFIAFIEVPEEEAAVGEGQPILEYTLGRDASEADRNRYQASKIKIVELISKTIEGFYWNTYNELIVGWRLREFFACLNQRLEGTKMVGAMYDLFLLMGELSDSGMNSFHLSKQFEKIKETIKCCNEILEGPREDGYYTMIKACFCAADERNKTRENANILAMDTSAIDSKVFALAEAYGTGPEQSFLPTTETVNFVAKAGTSLPDLATRDGSSAGVKNLSYHRKRKGEATSEGTGNRRCYFCNEVGHRMAECPARIAVMKVHEAKIQAEGIRLNDQVLGTNVSNLSRKTSYSDFSELLTISDKENKEGGETIKEEVGIGDSTVVRDVNKIFADGKSYEDLLPQGEVNVDILEDVGHWESSSEVIDYGLEDTSGLVESEDVEVRQCTSDEMVLLGDTELSGTQVVKDVEAVLDSGASIHVFKRKEYFLENDTMRRLIRTASGECVISDAKVTRGLIVGALWAPKVIHNLVSVKKLTDVGLKVVFNKGMGYILKGEVLVAQACARKDVYILDEPNLKKLFNIPMGILLSMMTVESVPVKTLTKGQDELMRIHRQLGHKSMDTIKAAVKSKKIIIENVPTRQRVLHAEVPQCEVCLMAKPKSKPINRQVTEFNGRPFEKIGMDVKGPFPPSVPGGYTYAFIFVDYVTSYIQIFLTTSMANGTKAVQIMAAKVLSFGFVWRTIMTDFAPGFRGGCMKTVMRNLGLVHETSAPYKQFMNGKIERFIGTLFGMVRAMISDGGGKIDLWAYALCHAAFLINYVPRSNGKPPAWYLIKEQVLSVQKLPIFFQRVVVKKQLVTNSLQERGEIGRFLGYYSGQINKSIILRENGTVMVSDDVVPLGNHEMVVGSARAVPNPNPWDRGVDDDGYMISNVEETEARKCIPRSYKEACNAVDSDKWMVAFEKERSNFVTHETFVGVSNKELRNISKSEILGSLLVLSRTKDNEGEDKYKVRVVARGDMQRGITQEEVFAPTTPCEINKLVINIAAANNLKKVIFDVSAAFLNGENTRVEYVRLPRYFAKVFNDKEDSNGEGIVRVNGNFYGLKQAPKVWWEKFRAILKDFGLVESSWCETLFFNLAEEEYMIVVVHVDDALLLYKNESSVKKLEEFIRKRVTGVKFSDKFMKYLGMEFSEDKIGVALGHKLYIKNKLRESEMKNFPKFKVSEDLKGSPTSELRARMGTLRFVVDRGLPSFLSYVNELSTGKYPMSSVENLEGHLVSREDRGIKFGKGGGSKFLVCFADASWNRFGDAISRVGGCYFLNEESGSHHSFSSKSSQGVKACGDSSCFVELLALFECITRGLYLLQVLRELKVLDARSKLHVFTDNETALKVIHSGYSSNSIRLLNIKINMVKIYVEEGLVSLHFVPGVLNPADILTKTTCTEKDFRRHEGVLLEGLKKNEELLEVVRSALEKTRHGECQCD